MPLDDDCISVKHHRADAPCDRLDKVSAIYNHAMRQPHLYFAVDVGITIREVEHAKRLLKVLGFASKAYAHNRLEMLSCFWWRKAMADMDPVIADIPQKLVA